MSENTLTVGRDGLLVVRAHNLHLKVQNGELVISEGRDHPDCRSGRFPRWRAPRRIALVGAVGIISVPALRWCRDTGCSLYHVDGIGRITMVSAPPRIEDARLRRTQAFLPHVPAGLDLARSLLGRKLRSQLELLRAHGLGTSAQRRRLQQRAVAAETAATVLDALAAESAGARLYWSAWRSVELRFARREQVSDDWRYFEQRTVASGYALPPRRGAHHPTAPLNALLGYSYAVAEAELRVELLALGLDAALGVLHADEPERDSMALDLLEPLRPLIDRLVLELATTHVWRRRDFLEEPTGRVRLALETAGLLPGAVQRLRPLIAQEAEQLAMFVADEAGMQLSRVKTTRRRIILPRVWVMNVPRNCEVCGAGPLHSGQLRCADCRGAPAPTPGRPRLAEPRAARR